ncbi:MAG: TolC family protein [Myxococcales bacterium]|nr:TolC family protein [Myxococcota bacterium]MDW8282747.1 TolC family protein [Myxococcales bacterium]
MPPLSLGEAVDTALRQHPRLASLRAAEAAAVARMGQARAAWLPQVTTQTSLRQDYSYQTGIPEPSCEPGQTSCPTRQPDLTSLRYSSQLTLSQLLYDFGRTSGRIAVAQASARVARSDRQTTQAQIVLGVIRAYYEALKAEALHEVAQQNLAQQAQRLRQAESFVAIGTRPEIDALTARTAHAQAELSALTARNQVLIARVQLLQAMGATDPTWSLRPLVSAPVPPLPEEGREVEELLAACLPLRPDYRALYERVRQAEAQLQAARADFYPQIQIGGSAGLSGTVGGLSLGAVGGATRPDLPTAGQPGFALQASLQITWAPFQGLVTVHAVREAEAQLLAARADLEALRQQVRSELQQALLLVENSQRALAAAESVLAQAEQQLAMAAGRYQAGVGNIIELGDAQLGVMQARAQRVQADYDLQVARAGLRLQLGQLVPVESGP